MRRLKFQFTIRQLIAWIAVCAVLLAVLRTPFAFVAFAIAAVLPGFLLERARGGSGILGGTLSSCLIAVSLLPVFFLVLVVFNPLEHALIMFFQVLLFVMINSLVCGAICSGVLWLLARPVEMMLRAPVRDESCGPIRLYPPADWGVQPDTAATD